MSRIVYFPFSEAAHPSARYREKCKPANKYEAAAELWTKPIDLGPGLLIRLLHGMAPVEHQRLAVFARKGCRVLARDLLAVSGESDVRALSHFHWVVTRRLRDLFDDRENKVHLIGWDFTTTKWDDDHARIVDGECYVTEVTQRALVHCLGHLPDRELANGVRRLPEFRVG